MKQQVNKKMLRRALSLILIMTMMVTGLHLDMMSESIYAAQQNKVENEKEKNLETIPEVVKEIKGERTENTNTYLLSDGSKKLEIAVGDIRYKEDGKWKDYDTTLGNVKSEELNKIENGNIRKSAYIYTNRQGKYKHYFAENVNEESPIIMTDNKCEISFYPIENKKISGDKSEKTADVKTDAESISIEGINKGNSSEINYSNVDQKVKYNYISLTNGIKENIVLEQKPKENIFKFHLNLKGLEAEVDKKIKQIYLRDKEKTIKAVIEAPNLIDSKNVQNYEDVNYELDENADGTYILSVIVDEKYLEKASYPVTIDPVYTWMTETNLDYRVTMSAGGAASSVINRSDTVTLMNSQSNKTRLYMKFKDLNQKLKGKYIYQSYFQMFTKEISGHVSIGVSDVLNDWNSSTITWNNQPDISNEMYQVLSEFKAEGSSYFKLTKWAKKIASGEINNSYGLAISCIVSASNSYLNLYSPYNGKSPSYLYVFYDDIEDVKSTYDGSFEMAGEINDNAVKLTWDSYRDDIFEYDIYMRKGNSFENIGRTKELEYLISKERLGNNTDFRVVAIKADNEYTFFYADKYLSNIVSIVKTESIDEDANETTIQYEQTALDTDGDGLEDGYEIWDFKTLWNTETGVDEEGNKTYDLDTDKDGFPDSYEVFTLGTDPVVGNEEGKDSDGDGWSDLTEYQKGTDPWIKDSDFDEISDRADETPRRTDEGEDVATVAQATRTSQTQAAAAVVNKGLYDREYSEVIDGVTYTYIKNIYKGNIKKVYADYGDVALNKTIKYFYDEYGNNTAIVESYDESYDPKHTQTICITYTYDKDNNVIFICDQKTKYTMNYDANGTMVEMNIGNQNIMSYADTVIADNTVEGDDSNINIGDIIDQRENVSTYGNQQSVKTITTTYKINDSETSDISNQKAREVKIYYNNSIEASYVMEYNIEGNIISVSDYSVDNDNPTVINYVYSETGTVASIGEDFTSRILREEDEENDSYTTTKTYTYKDLSGNSKTHTDISTVITEKEILDSGEEKAGARIQQTFINGDNLSESIGENSFKKILHSNKYSTDVIKSTYEKTETNASLNVDIYASNEDKNIEYAYDLVGNITSISINKQIKYAYEYDAHGRLITETDYVDSKKYSYDYNTTGNLRAKTKFNLNSEGKTESGDSGTTIRYAYGNGEWPDQLTTYNGQNIAYDNAGNPLTYINGLKFTWMRGRQLSQIETKDNDTITYKYNQDGLRTYKDTSDTTSIYYWQDNVLIREKVTYKASKQTCDIWYIYDAGGEVVGYEYSYFDLLGKEHDVTIYYEKNLQGDVIGLLDSRGAEIATYMYDAWGNITASNCIEGNEISYELNHITYRGYYRDNETGFYYLQSRYYDAEIGRFINADDVKYLGNSGTVWGYNLYTYCEANPVNSVDPQGTAAITLSFLGIIFVVATVVYACAVITSPQYRKSWGELCNSAVKGIVKSLRGIGLAVNWVTAKTKEITKALENSFARANPMTRYRWNKELHHVVAKAAYNAQYAREKLKAVGLKVDSKENLIWIKTGLHRRLHTNLYYGFANSVVISAYNRGYNYKKRRENVLTALRTLKAFISALDRAAPF